MKLSRSQLKLVVDVEISMQEPGYVQLVAIKEGEQIDKGQLLIELHATLHRADLKISTEGSGSGGNSQRKRCRSSLRGEDA